MLRGQVYVGHLSAELFEGSASQGAAGGQCWRKGPSPGAWEEPVFPARGESGGIQGLERDLRDRSVAVGRREGVQVKTRASDNKG